jgi:hypothetical protein
VTRDPAVREAHTVSRLDVTLRCDAMKERGLMALQRHPGR